MPKTLRFVATPKDPIKIYPIPELTDVDLTEAFTRVAQGLLIWIPDKGWAGWDTATRSWVPDNTFGVQLATKFVSDLSKQIDAEALEEYLEKKQKFEDTLKVFEAKAEKARTEGTQPPDRPFAPKPPNSTRSKLCSKYKLKAIEDLSKFQPCLIEPLDSFDVDPYLLRVPKGVIDLRTSRLRPGEKSDRMLQCTAVDPSRRDITSDLWESFLDDFTMRNQETRDWLQRFFGYCLTGLTTEERFLILHGEGGSGKGTFTKAVCSAMGDYGIDTKAGLLEQGSATAVHATNEVDLHKARLAITPEVKRNAPLDVVRLKRLTGGDEITANKMRQDNFSFDPTHKLVVSSNWSWRLPDTDESLVRRLLVVRCDFQPKVKDATLKQRLLEPAHQRAILRWLVEGARMYFDRGIELTEDVREWSRDYIEAEDNIVAWLRSEFDQNPKSIDVLRVTEAHLAFREWASANLSGFVSRDWPLNDFSRALRSHGYEIKRPRSGKSRQRFYVLQKEKRSDLREKLNRDS